MQEIKIAGGYITLIDDEDINIIKKRKWRILNGKRNKTLYARGHKNINGKWVTIMMHREILGLPPSRKPETDHINGNGLDNRKCNLRIVTSSENHLNFQTVWNKHGIKGIFYDKRRQARPWGAALNVKGKIHFLGYYATKEEAGVAHLKTFNNFYFTKGGK